MDTTSVQNFVGFIDAHPYVSALILIWIILWKGLALWRAAERHEPSWFVALLVINTLGLLEIIYLFFIIKTQKAGKSSSSKQ